MEFKLPELGENVTFGDVLRVLVSPGDRLTPDRPIVELETDKATIEVPSGLSGVVKEITVKSGDRVKVGQTIMIVEEEAGRVAGPLAAPRPTAKASPETATLAGSAPDTPAVRRGEVVDIGRGGRLGAVRGPAGAPAAAEAGAPAIEAVPAAPSVRRLARELGVDIHEVPGSGPGGRISAEDVKAYTRRLVSRGAPGAGVGHRALPDFTRWGEVERVPMRGVRRKTAEHVSHAWATIPHVTQHDCADITQLDEFRKRYAAQVEAAGGRLTLTAIVLKLVASTLKAFPQFSASVDMAAEEIVYKKYFHIGVAVDTQWGLLVPVVRDVDRKSLAQLSIELAQLAERARQRKLALDEMEGGSFTVTNLGGLGGTAFSPIVNWPEVAILGLARASIQPVFKDGAFHPRLLLPLSLSYDHRLIDGADAVRFLRRLVETIEQPLLIALEG